MTWWFVHDAPRSWQAAPYRVALAAAPAPTIMAYGLHGDRPYRYRLEDDGMPDPPAAVDKPPYAIPPMAELAATPPSGLVAVSLFSGCGGGCLGLRWAGYRVVYASEFIPAAAETYRANFPETPVDPRDVRAVTAAEIRALAGIGDAEIDLLEGSPPCAAFSAAGKLEAGWGQVRKYSETHQRVDDLFDEYARLLETLRPRAFVAENVAGLARGVAKGYFKRILARLRACGYRVEARLIDAQWLGVPQTRARLFFVGLRADVPGAIPWPRPLPYRYTVADALPALRGAGVGTHNGARPVDAPLPTVQTHGRAHTESELTLVGDGPALDGYAIAAEYDKLRPGESSERYLNLARAPVDGACPTVTALGGANAGVAAVAHPTERRKFTIAELRRLCGFPDDFILTGTYSQQWERLGRAVMPPVMRAIGEALRPLLCGEPRSAADPSRQDG